MSARWKLLNLNFLHLKNFKFFFETFNLINEMEFEPNIKNLALLFNSRQFNINLCFTESETWSKFDRKTSNFDYLTTVKSTINSSEPNAELSEIYKTKTSAISLKLITDWFLCLHIVIKHEVRVT